MKWFIWNGGDVQEWLVQLPCYEKVASVSEFMKTMAKAKTLPSYDNVLATQSWYDGAVDEKEPPELPPVCCHSVIAACPHLQLGWKRD